MCRAPCRILAALGCLIVLQSSTPVHAQVDPPPKPGSTRVRVVPAEMYRAGSSHRSLFGSGYRDLWTTAIEVPVADLSTLGGGLVPVRLGGGMTTRTLHLMGGDGRRYVFRSVDKSPVEFESFAGSALAELLQDQVSSFHPSGAPVVSRLLDAVGVLHTDPRFMVVPDDPALREFRSEFAGLLVLFEERPDDGVDGAVGFGGSVQIAQTDDLFEALEKNADHRVDAEELLRARLVDLLVGDRDRSHNNHLWARFADPAGGFVWRVIPRDRDQAFVRFDGLLKSVARRYDRRLVTFDGIYPDIFALTRNAWDMDRRLLVGLPRDRWDAIVREVQQVLDDVVVAEAVARMPPEHVAVLGGELSRVLIDRRNHLHEAADALYRVVFSVPDISATDADEELRVVRGGDDRVTVTLTPVGNHEPTYHRVFAAEETAEIRIYLQGGDDHTVLEGGGADRVRVRVVGGGGADSFEDRSWRPQPQTTLYDGDADTRFPTTGWAGVIRSTPRRPYSWFELDRDLDWGTLTVPAPTASYDRDRGLVIVPGLRQERYGFMSRPYSVRIRARAGWALGLQEPLFDLHYLARDILAGGDLSTRFRWSGMEIINFYGFGNETSTDRPVAYHRVVHKQVRADISAAVGDGDRWYLEFGPTFTYTSTDSASTASFIGETDPYGSGKFAHAGLRAAFGLDRRDHLGTPTRGFRTEVELRSYPQFFDSEGTFRAVRGEVAAYVAPVGDNPVLAVRAAGERVSGRFPFFEAAFLGGASSVRSLREQRYAGDSMLLGSAELRVELFRMVFPLPSDVGVFALADAGRVSMEGSASNRWHTAVGGGVWFALINRSNVVRIGVARGEDRTAVNAGLGFAY